MGDTCSPTARAEGSSYLLDTPLAEGETVNASVELTEGGPVESSFTVAHLAPQSPTLELTGEQPEQQEHFLSEPTLRPPKVKVNLADPSLPGDIFLDPLPAPIIHVGAKLLEFHPVGPNGLMILNPEGKLVWWKQLPENYAASNLELTTYEGKRALAWWQGTATQAAYGNGEGIIANTSYEPIARVAAGNGYEADIHELNITPAGTAYIDVYRPICLPVCSEANPPVISSIVQEIDIKTGLVMWEWHALGHVPIADTEVIPAGGVFDPYHVNAIQPLAENRVLISLRDTSAVYDVEQDGSIVWTVGGKKSSFALAPRAQFYFQHDVRLQGNGLTMFDDEAGPPVHGSARALVLRLNMTSKTATVQREFARPGLTIVVSEGGAQHVAGGNVMVGFGATPYFSEFSSAGPHKEGTMLFEAALPEGDGSYRANRYNWKATPKTLPALAAVRESPGEVAVSASWNGATAVATWEVLAGEGVQALSRAATAPWAGFETKISVPTSDKLFEVRALSSGGKVLATSGPVSAP